MKQEEAEPLVITSDMLVPRRGPARTRIDFERSMSYAPPFTLALMFFLAVAFAFEVNSGALRSEEALVGAGALVRSKVLAGDWWRLFSASALHGGLSHLIGNLISLYILGMACEHAFGSGNTFWLYLGSALTGSVLSLLLNPGPSVGASGAIFGLLGGLVVFLVRHEDKFHVRDKRVGVVLVAWAVYTLAQGFLTPFVDNGAHLGGLAGGAILGGLLPSALPGGASGSQGAWRSAS